MADKSDSSNESKSPEESEEEEKNPFTVLQENSSRNATRYIKSLPKSQLLEFISLRNSWGRSLLHVAAAMGHLDVVEILVEADSLKEMINGKDNSGWAPIHLASYNGYIDIIDVLVANGADVNLKNACGRTALYYATTSGRMNTAESLIACGADVNTQDEVQNLSSYPNYIHMTEHKKLQILTITLVLHTKGCNLINYRLNGPLYANQRNSWTRLELNKVRTFNCRPPIVYTYPCNFSQILLHKCCIMANALNIQIGFTPLHRAAGKGYINLCELLLNSGARIDTLDKTKESPLVHAFFCKQIAAVVYLIRKGAVWSTLDDPDEKLQSLLDHAHEDLSKPVWAVVRELGMMYDQPGARASLYSRPWLHSKDV
ncbi:E3 ubiquitin-protein ligase MIB2 [Bienertia sinuspersici]